MIRSRILPFCMILLLLSGCTGPGAVSTAAPTETAPATHAWTVFGQTVSEETPRITVQAPFDFSAVSDESLSALSPSVSIDVVFTDGWSGDLSAFADFLSFSQSHPDLHIEAQFPQGDAPVDRTELTVDQPFDGLDAVLAACPSLQALTLSDSFSRESIAAIAAAHPSLRILWEDAGFGASDSSATALTVTGDADPAALGEYLNCFPALETVDLRGCSLSESDGSALCRRFPSVAFLRTVTLNGVPTDTNATELNLDNAVIESYDAFSEALGFFPRLSHVELNDCSLSNEQLAALRDRYPEKGIVWTVRIRTYRIRTDSVAFSAKSSGYNTNRMTSMDVDPLRYCTDLIALDLGHNDLTDLDFLRPLTNLQVLMLADSRKLEDISVIGTLHRLKYLELFMTGVSDITPIGELPELLDVNLCVTKVADVSPLLSCKKLERIWLGTQTVQNHTTEESIRLIEDAFPNADIELDTASCTGHGWREHPRYDAYIEMFKTGRPVAPFLP